jgi:hypothetical protein
MEIPSADPESRVTAEVHDLLVACGEHFVAENWSLSGLLNVATREQISSSRSNIGPCITALLQLDGSVEECRFAAESVRNMRWSSGFKKNSFRLRLYRFAFLNACYSYTERIKLVSDQFKLAETDLASPTIMGVVGAALKSAKKQLRPFNQERGEIVHSWHHDHRAIYLLSMVETLADIDAEKYGHDVRGHYADSRYDILSELKRGIAEIERLHAPLLREAAIVLKDSVLAFNKRVEEAKLRGLVVNRV